MGNSQTAAPVVVEENPEPKNLIRVKIGIACLGFVPCVHFIYIEGIEGWVAYEAPMIVRCFFKNRERFYFDSKFMPQLEIERPNEKHFEWYEKLEPIDPDEVVKLHKRALATGSLVSESRT
jgi:hypothetical protein